MDEQQYKRFVKYVVNGKYPDGFTKSEKFILRQVNKSYSTLTTVQEGKLFHEDNFKMENVESPSFTMIQWQCSVQASFAMYTYSLVSLN